jgi:hypothetical protein
MLIFLMGRFPGSNRKLIIPVETRWYTQYNTVLRLWDSRRIIEDLLESEEGQVILDAMKPCDRDPVLLILRDRDFWVNLKVLRDILAFPSSIIGKMENDSTDISQIYRYFRRTELAFQALDISKLTGCTDLDRTRLMNELLEIVNCMLSL